MLKASKLSFILLKLIIFKIFVCKEHWKPYLQNLNPENELFICRQERERKHASIGLFNLCIELRQENVCFWCFTCFKTSCSPELYLLLYLMISTSKLPGILSQSCFVQTFWFLTRQEDIFNLNTAALLSLNYEYSACLPLFLWYPSLEPTLIVFLPF